MKNGWHFEHISTWMSFFCLLYTSLLLLFPDQLISLYLKEGGETAGDLQYTLQCAREYLFIMLLGLPAFALTQCYSTTLRETKETILPMTGSIPVSYTHLSLSSSKTLSEFSSME